MKKATEGSKLEKLIEAIEAKKQELSGYETERTAAGHAQEIVDAEKKVERAKAQLALLEEAKAAYDALKPVSEAKQMTEGLQKYEKAYQSKINEAIKLLRDNETEITQTQKAIKAAQDEMDAVKMLTLNDRLEDLQKERKIYEKQKAAAEAAEKYPKGALSNEWDVMCENYMPEWEGRLEAVRSFAAAYKNAVLSLDAMKRNILDAKAYFKSENGGKDEFTPHFVQESGVTMDSNHSLQLGGMEPDEVVGVDRFGNKITIEKMLNGVFLGEFGNMAEY